MKGASAAWLEVLLLDSQKVHMTCSLSLQLLLGLFAADSQVHVQRCFGPPDSLNLTPLCHGDSPRHTAGDALRVCGSVASSPAQDRQAVLTKFMFGLAPGLCFSVKTKS